MNDEHGRVEPHAISWAEPDLANAKPTWAGPAPDAREDETPAPAPAPPPSTPARTGGMSQAWASWTSAAPVAPAPEESADSAASAAPVAPPQEHTENEPVNATEHTPVEPLAQAGPVAAPGPQGEQPDQAADSGARLGSTPLSEQPAPVEAPAQRAHQSQGLSDDDPHHGYDQSFMDEPVAAEPAPAPASVTPAPVAHPEDEAVAGAPSAPFQPEAPVETAAPEQHLSAEQAPVEPAANPAQAAPPEALPHEPAPAESESAHEAAPSAEQAPAPVEEPVHASAPPQVVGQNDEIPEDALTIGRSRSNVIVLDDMLVSRRHVVITADEEGLLLRDLGSRNGTYVNGERVEHSHLDEGDRIGIGASTFEVRDGWLVSI